MFVTSIKNNGNLSVGSSFIGVNGGDYSCQYYANLSGLGVKWKAWLSNSTISASSRLHHSNVPYKLVNGVTVANNWNDLTDGSLLAPINVNESGAGMVNTSVWTNTNYNGEIYSNNAISSCDNFRSSSLQTAVVGNSSRADNTWTVSNIVFCNTLSSLYCFEQPN